MCSKHLARGGDTHKFRKGTYCDCSRHPNSRHQIFEHSFLCCFPHVYVATMLRWSKARARATSCKALCLILLACRWHKTCTCTQVLQGLLYRALYSTIQR